MRVLLTNDDGIHAAGLKALYQELKSDFQVHIVAPNSEMSAVGHAITLTSPLRVQEVYKNGNFFGYGVKGTPADCIKIAVQELLEAAPDVILSGINLGANVGVNVLYSGTVVRRHGGRLPGHSFRSHLPGHSNQSGFSFCRPVQPRDHTLYQGKRPEGKNRFEREYPCTAPGKDLRCFVHQAGCC